MPVLDAVREPFRALASTIVPEAEDLDAAGWARLETIVEEALAERPPAMQRQLALFVRLLDLIPLFRWGRTFRRLDRARRIDFLHRVQNARLFLFRRGFWGLRTLVFMGYYARIEAYDEIGYGARLRGWLEHPAAPESAREATRSAAVDQGAADAGEPPPPEPGATGEPSTGEDA